MALTDSTALVQARSLSDWGASHQRLRAQPEANGLWRQRGLAAFKPTLDEVWTLYLGGRRSRDEASAALVARAGSAR